MLGERTTCVRPVPIAGPFHRTAVIVGCATWSPYVGSSRRDYPCGIESVAVLLVVSTVAVHFAFIAYVLAGGFLAFRWPRTIGVHVVAVAWGFAGLLAHWPCPLTVLERRARALAGMSPLPPDGFIAHYLTGVLYPKAATGVVELLLAAVIALSWACYARHRNIHHRSTIGAGPPDPRPGR